MTDTFPGRVHNATLGYFQILSMYLGLRLGLYEALGSNDLTSDALAKRAGIDSRYAREWCEQQATIGVLAADTTREPPAFRLPGDVQESLLDPDSISYLGATIRQLASLRAIVDPVVEAYRTGTGLDPELFGAESADGQGDSNRPVYLTTLPTDWLPNIEPFRSKLEAGATRVVDIGCGHGWSSISLALAYPSASVNGFDPDAYSIEQARGHAARAGVADRVRFHVADAATIDATADLVMAFECIHDMPNPVEVLGAARDALTDDGAMLVVDERVRDRFDGMFDATDAYFYGWSIFDCLPAGRAASPSAATGTVMRPDTLRSYAEAAGFTGFEVLPIDHDAFRLYMLRP
ncbi:MAG TPA: class I SAM-dependent methyltransferase [Actinomycetota bacterium]|jgi:SAM-dependent methyltransferase|nr:class I SAM-dependent methyltransferase [Actinomycetota bacterium]